MCLKFRIVVKRTDFKESVKKARQEDDRYEVSIPWIPGADLSGTSEQACRRRLGITNKKLMSDEKREYKKIVVDQLNNGIVDRAAKVSAGKYVNYRVSQKKYRCLILHNAKTMKAIKLQ